MKPKLLKRLAFGLLVLAGIGLIFVVRPAYHLLRSAALDVDDRIPAAAGNVDDASRLDETPVAQVWQMPAGQQAEPELAELLARAQAARLKVSIAGARHSMGGHTFTRQGLVVDMLGFNQLSLDVTNLLLHAQAGARWSQILPYLNAAGYSVEIMQSNDDFSIGGSLSVNCHGWQFDRPPISSSVVSFRFMRADGSIVRCSRRENEELFRLALGGYGLFGIILDADLRIVPNERYQAERLRVPASTYAATLATKRRECSDLAMVYGRLRITREGFLQEAIINLLHRVPSSSPVVSQLGEIEHAELKRLAFRGGAGSEYGKQFRWDAETSLDRWLSGKLFERNDLLFEPAALFQNHRQDHTDILMECFLPPAQFEAFLAELRDIIPAGGCDLLNITVRHVNEDRDSFLRYADRELFSLVMLFNQRRDTAGEEAMVKTSREIIAAALRHEGRYYLPYRPHATPEQFAAAYPRAKEFFALKRKYDPGELFENEFYRRYGK